MKWCCCLLVSLLLLAGPVGAQAEERITDYDINVSIETSADLIVTETIRVISEGVEIRRGIFRDLPAVHTTTAGLFDLVDYDVLAVTRDGDPEPFFTVPQGEFVRVYIGREDRFLKDGPHIYRITYRVSGQIRFSEGADELYWNLTGTGWAFPIERVTAEIDLPDEAEISSISGYTGSYGQAGRDYEILNASGSRALLRGTRRFEPGEGVTVSLSWQPGVLSAPGTADRIRALLDDNPGATFGLLSLGLLSGYFLLVWWHLGRDPQKGIIIPLFDPPKGFSPAAVGHIHARGFADGMAPARALTVGITSLAVKGLLTIEDQNKSRGTRYILRRTDKPATGLPPGEQALISGLFNSAEENEIRLGSTYDPVLEAAKNAFMSAVSAEYSDTYFRRNGGKWFFGLVFAAATSKGSAALNTPGGEDAMGMGAAVTLFFGVFLSVFYWTVRMCWQRSQRLHAVGGRKPFLIALVIMAVAAIPAGGFGLAVALIASTPVALAIAAMIGLVFIFYDLLDALTVRGREIADQIEGYILFMTTTDWDRMRAIGDMPTPTLAMFEKHLPYSIALGVDDAWTRTFTRYAEAASIPIETHQTSWYHSSEGHMAGPSEVSKSLSSRMAGAMAAASTRTSSSSSGSSGRGSSGGGGGGGGGGGW